MRFAFLQQLFRTLALGGIDDKAFNADHFSFMRHRPCRKSVIPQAAVLAFAAELAAYEAAVAA